MYAATGMMLAGTGVMPVITVVMPVTAGMMPAAMVVMAATTVVSPDAPGMMSAVMVAAYEETAGLPLPTRAMELRTRALLNPARMLHITAGEAPGSGRPAPVLAFVSLELG